MLIACASTRTEAANSDWMSGHYGLMTHYTPCADQIDYYNQVVNQFDVNAFATDVAQSGATYIVFTLGQENFFCSPNTTLNGLCNTSVTSSRDLIHDVAIALAAKNIKLIVYMPSNAPVRMQDGTKYTVECAADQQCRRAVFQQNWQNAIAEYSRRWGSLVSGWWFDGCYNWSQMYAFTTGPNFQTFAAAARAGNANAVVTFNDGSGPYSNHTQFGDFSAGEIHFANQTLIECEGRWINGTDPATGALYQVQWNLNTFLGHAFVGGSQYTDDTPRFSNSYIANYVKRVTVNGGTCQLDVPLHMGGCHDSGINLEGHLSANFTSQLQSIAAALQSPAVSLGQNVAVGRPASASNTFSGLTPANGVDGNTGTIWASGTDGSSVKWWQVDLGTRKPINAVQVIFSQTDSRDFLRQNFQIEASDDPNFGSYDLVGTETLACYLPAYSDFFAAPTQPITHRYVRVTRSPSDPDWFYQHIQVAEARVYSSSAPPPTTMLQGGVLLTNQYIVSPTGKCFLIMQSDGNLVLYAGSGPNDNHGGLWAALTAPKPIGSYFATLQTDGNLCIYKGTGPTNNQGFVWGNFTSGQDFLQLGDDMKLSVCRGTGSSNNLGVLWSVP